MQLTRRTWLQLSVFAIVTLSATAAIGLGYMRLPSLLFGIGRYDVTLQLPVSAGLYERSNVTYRGVEIGQVHDVRLSDGQVLATLTLRSSVPVPSDLDAAVHSRNAVGEQYVELLPRNDTAEPLRQGSVIPLDRTTVPPDINDLLDSTNRGLQAIPGDNLKTVIDESYLAYGGLGPEIARIVKGSTALATGARDHLPAMTNLIDNSPALMDSQTRTADSVRVWANRIAEVSRQFADRDDDIVGILRDGPPAAEQVRALFDEVNPTLPVLLSNLVTVEPVLVTYQQNLEQVLVLSPLAVAEVQGIMMANHGNRSTLKGLWLDAGMQFNLPPPCMTGFLPPQQVRPPALEDYPDRPVGDLYCRIPQDASNAVRGVRNTPCVTRPGKRAPTVKMCESDEQYVPLNDGWNWKGDPNATLTGQSVPQLRTGTTEAQAGVAPAAAQPNAAPVNGAPPTAPPPVEQTPPLAFAEYDPQSGDYTGPDGRVYTRGEVARAGEPNTWQSMLVPPGS